MPKQAICHLLSLSPVQQSKYIMTEKEEKETHDAHERRTWKERAHVNADGKIFIPGIAFKKSIAEAARFLGSAGALKIPGQRNSTYTKHFVAGFLVENDIVTEYTLDTVRPMWLFVPSDGTRGGGKRVNKCFPVIDRWEGDLSVVILDDTLTEAVFERVILEAGRFIGVGAFRPQNGGTFGRYLVDSVKWKPFDLQSAA